MRTEVSTLRLKVRSTNLKWRAPRWYRRSNAAVSYTHLRAHETVLDLVCRLLLEKKKTTENTYPTAASYNTSTDPLNDIMWTQVRHIT